MSFGDRLKRARSGQLATAIPATSAISTAKIARVATVAVANTPESQVDALVGLSGRLAAACIGTAIQPEHVLRECSSPKDIAILDEYDDAQLRNFIGLLEQRAERMAGRVPRTFTKLGCCDECGPVHVPSDWDTPSKNCPWCWNRAKGLMWPVPGEFQGGK